jgi:hypothetical protein
LTSLSSSRGLFLFWHWWEPQLNQVLVVNRNLGITSGHCLRAQSWSERQGVHGKAYWKWKVKISPSRQKLRARAIQLKSTVVWSLAGFYVVSARLVGESWIFLQVGLGQLADLIDS